MNNLQLSWTLTEIAALLELLDENPFRIRAYRRAARSIELLPDDVKQLWEADELQHIDGVGKGIQADIDEWLTTGRIDVHEQLKQQVPPGLLDIVRVPGVGPKSAQLLHAELGIRSLDELEAACRDEKVRTVKGMGPKTEANILRGIERLREQTARTPIGIALPFARSIVNTLATLSAVNRIELTGSLRRGRETTGDIDIVASSDEGATVIDYFVGLPGVVEVLSRGETKGSVIFNNGMQADLLVVADTEFASAVHHFTGSKEHNIALREGARGYGLKISEYGITDNAGRRLPISTEADVFAALELPYIPPELREDGTEITVARAGRLPRLITMDDIRGDLHAHSTWSDGHNSIPEMAEAARARGYEYIAITDHSRSLGVAGGLTPAELVAQIEEIERLNANWDDFRILTGTEVDILADGTLDFDDELLARLDIVIASVHSAMQQDEQTMTERIVTAMNNPHVDIIGHPTGRIIGRRDGYAVDMAALIDAAAATGTCLEINASPERLDLKDVDARRARRAGVMLVVNTDAHRTDGFEQMTYGMTVARRAWLTADDVLNCLPLSELKARLKDGGR